MRNLFKNISSFLPGHGGDAAHASAAASPSVSAEAKPGQHLLPLDGDGIELHDPTPTASQTSRALNSVVRATTSVVVRPHGQPPVLPHAHSFDVQGGVALTETERARLRIMQVQIRLASLMLYEGPIDGTLNLDTVAGLRHFQTLKGLRETGQITAITMRALGVPSLD